MEKIQELPAEPPSTALEHRVDIDELQHLDELDVEWVNAWRKTVC